jgi:hypothetical protein
MNIIDKVHIMVTGLEKYLKSINYDYFEYNYVPDWLFGKNHSLNVFFRLFFRLSIINFRKKQKSYPAMPQSLVSMLKAYNVSGNKNVLLLLLPRLLSLKSPKTNNFALSQGIRIAVNLYENDSLDPTPLNTLWFGEFVLEENLGIFNDSDRKEMLLSIGDYLINELGFIDYADKGIYFFYGPTLKKEIYNASAITSSFLLDIGHKYNIEQYNSLGELGVKYILNKQNYDGSWFYADIEKGKSIDNFHQSYILQALAKAKKYLSFSIDENYEKGKLYYKNRLFRYKNQYIIPLRYDRRYLPRNTWLLQKLDGRDLVEALVFFSKYEYQKEMVDGLINYTYDIMYDKKKGCFASEILIYGKNRIPYLEFQGWYLYALKTVAKYY